MANRLDPHARLAFGPFSLDVAKGELRKAGIRVRLSGQPIEILMVLLAHGGEVVTREQLREQLWSDGTFVDFEGGLNAAMGKLRRGLGDSAQSPRYIETVARQGYRFLGRIDSLRPENQTPVDQSISADTSPPFGKTPAWRSVTTRALIAMGILVTAFSAVLAWAVNHSSTPSLPIWRLSPLTTSAALEDWAAVSPDGKVVVYSADPDFSGQSNLYMKILSNNGAPVRLTADGEGNRMPDFSPDGRRIVFRSNRNGGGIYQMPALGGEIQLVAEGGLNPKYSPDGQTIVYWVGAPSVAASVPESGSVWIVPVNGGQPRRIASQLTSARAPIWFPDGKSVLLIGYDSAKALDPASIDWWVASLSGANPLKTGLYDQLIRRRMQPSDTTTNSRVRTPVPTIPPPGCWSAKLDAVVTTLESGDNGSAAMRSGNNSNLWAVGIRPGTSRLTGALTPITSGAANEWNVSCSPAGTFALTNVSIKRQLWTLPFDFHQAISKGPLRQIVEDANDRENPTSAADGSTLAFVSSESGRPNIWRRDLKTGVERQVANSTLVQRFPSISPSGRKIAYSVYDSNKRVLYMVDADHQAQKLCEDCTRATDWSRDEDSLLIFGGNPYQIKLLNLSTQQSTPLLSHNKYHVLYGHFSPDGHWISFTIRIRSDLARIAIARFDGAKTIPEDTWIPIADVGIDDYANWSPDSKTLYFSSPKDGNSCLWARHIDPATGQPTGTDYALQHFHGRVTFDHGGWTPAGDGLTIGLVDKTSNVWTMTQ